MSATRPRLIYVGDVPVESSYHGSALLYRLLEGYPAEKLRVVEAGLNLSMPPRRLPGVRYEDFRLPLRRLARTRLGPLYESLFLLLARARARRFRRLADEFRAEAVLSVAHGLSWIGAAGLAGRIGAPFHLICHDDWTATVSGAVWNDASKRRIFGKHYRRAASRLCVSPFMAEEYEIRYGAPGSVLYPSRASDVATFTAPPERLARTDGEFVCAFAGSVNSAEYAAALKLLAECLVPLGGRLLIFGPMDAARAAAIGLTTGNVEFGGLLTSRALIETLRKRADALFAPMSFSPDHRANMEISFPSKLTDYSAVGLPLLIHGPSYCSAVRWAEANAPVAEVVASEGREALSRSLWTLATRPAYRMQLARAALAAGRRYFSHEAADEAFSAALAASAANEQGKDGKLQAVRTRGAFARRGAGA